MQDRIVQHLIDTYNPEAILLHGSRARGAERVNSDWDFYVLTNDPNLKGGTELFEDQELDVDIVHLPLTKPFFDRFTWTLQEASLLFEKEDAGSTLLQQAADFYAQGCHLNDEEIKNRRRKLSRAIARTEGSVHDPLLTYYHAGNFFKFVTRYWFELRHQWPQPPAIGLPIIENEDPVFFNYLQTIATSKDPQQVVSAYKQIYSHLFQP